MAHILITANLYPHLLAQVLQEDGLEVSFCPAADLKTEKLAAAHVDLCLHGRPNLAINEALAHPREAYEQHVGTMLQLLKVLAQICCPRVLFLSSATVYGEHDLAREDAPLHPLEPNAASLKMAEEMLTAMPLTTVILRPGEIVGTPLVPDSEQNFVQNLSATILQQEKFILAGTDYPTPDGTMVRDIIHLDDWLAAIRAAGRYLLSLSPSPPTPPHPQHHIFNIGRGVGVSVREMMSAMEAASHQALAYTCSPRPLARGAKLVLSNQAAQDVLAWHPTHHSLAALAHAALAAQSLAE